FFFFFFWEFFNLVWLVRRAALPRLVCPAAAGHQLLFEQSERIRTPMMSWLTSGSRLGRNAPHLTDDPLRTSFIVEQRSTLRVSIKLWIMGFCYQQTSGFAQVVGDDFPRLHTLDFGAFALQTATIFLLASRRRSRYNEFPMTPLLSDCSLASDRRR